MKSSKFAITSSSYMPKAWKHYVDDTFTTLDRGTVDDFYGISTTRSPPSASLSRQNDTKLAFLDTAVSREPDGRLTTSVNKKPTHTDQYLAYDSHHPQSVKRGTVKVLIKRNFFAFSDRHWKYDLAAGKCPHQARSQYDHVT